MLGILAIVCAAIPGVGLVLGIVAVTRGARAAAEVRLTGQIGRGMAIAGLVLGVIGIAASITLPILFVVLL